MQTKETSEFVETLSTYMQEREEILSPLTELSEEIYQASLEADQLLQASQEFESAFSSLLEKHAKR
jgi:hypothetical protein